MALPVPKLDDRSFQDIVDEAKKRIPYYCQEWTDHNVSDPGVTFIELFAWMTDMLMYRLNRVPERHTIQFMEMMGIQLRPPTPARVPVTFWLAAPQPTAVLIPAGTEVSTTQTETERPIVFTTVDHFSVLPPELEVVMSRIATERLGQKKFLVHNLRRLLSGFGDVELFSSVPQADDALYFGFKNDLSHHILSIAVDCNVAEGAGIDPSMPPYVWEASTSRSEERWAPCQVESDTSQGMNTAGHIILHLPQMGKLRVDDQSLYWVRVRIKEISRAERREGMLPYEVTPRLRQLQITSIGGATMAVHAERVTNEVLGRSTGEPGQHFKLQRAPVLERQPGEHLLVQGNGRVEAWSEVPDFAESGPDDRHYTVDSNTGEVRFGPAIRQRDGFMKRYGAIPPRNTTLIFTSYRVGGGLEGNVEAGALNTLKTAIPYIARVLNRAPASGGLDAETIEEAMMRLPLMMRSRNRAVTAADFEFLARQALPAVAGRVKCFQPLAADGAAGVAPGQVYVLVVPQVRYPAGYLSPEELQISPEDIATLTGYLDERRLLTTRLNVRTPAYRWVAVKVTAAAVPGVDQGVVEREILQRLYRFLNPLTGGPDGQGWPFGRDLFVSEVYQALQGTPNLLFTRKVELYLAAPGGRRTGEPLEKIDVVSHGVVASGIHEVELLTEYTM